MTEDRQEKAWEAAWEQNLERRRKERKDELEDLTRKELIAEMLGNCNDKQAFQFIEEYASSKDIIQFLTDKGI